MGKIYMLLLLTASIKSAVISCYSLLLLQDTSLFGNEFPGWECYWSVNQKSYLTGPQINSAGILCYCAKMRALLGSPNDFFEASGKSIKKRKVCKLKAVIQNSAFKGHHEFRVRLHKGLNMLKLLTPIFLLRRSVL